jgi:protein SCO1
MNGAVVSIQPAAHQATIQHGAIPGFMEAMTMPYVIRDDAELRKLSAGDQITADLMVNKETGEVWLANVRVIKLSSK